jgi:hypothetical protein
VRVLPRASLAPEHVAALDVLVERWQCTESEAIRRALVAAAEGTISWEDRARRAEALVERICWREDDDPDGDVWCAACKQSNYIGHLDGCEVGRILAATAPRKNEGMSDTKWVNLSDALAGMPGMSQGVHVTSYDWTLHVAPPDGLVESVQCPDCLALVSLVDGQIRNACRCGRVWVVARAPDPVQGPVRYDFSGVRVLPKVGG